MQITAHVTIFYGEGAGALTNIRADSFTIGTPSPAVYQECVRRTVEAALAENEHAPTPYSRSDVHKLVWAVYPGAPLASGTYKP